MYLEKTEISLANITVSNKSTVHKTQQTPFTAVESVVEGRKHSALPKFSLESLLVCTVETPSATVSIMNPLIV